MWLRNDCLCLMPFAVFLKRLAAPLLLLIFGMRRTPLEFIEKIRGQRLTSSCQPLVDSAVGSLLLGGNNHDHLPPFHFWKGLHGANLFEIGGDTLHQLATEVLMGHLASAEAQGHLALVATFEEAYQVLHLDLIVALVGTRPE